MRRLAGVLGGALVVLLGLGWAGLRVQPAPFQSAATSDGTAEYAPIPTSLPAPVARFYRATYGDRVPVVKSAVVTGRGTMTLFGLTFPSRFRFNYDEARNFRTYFEITVFGFPIMRVNEYFVNGSFRAELPPGVEEGSPKLNQSANVRLWSEYLTWLPAVLLADPRVRWEAVDDELAILVVPFDQEIEKGVRKEVERIVVRFDPATGLVRYFEAMRYQSADSPVPILWVNGVWHGAAPWANWVVDETALNVPVDVSLTRKGP